MRRLKAVLSPAPVAGSRPRLAVLGLGVAVAAVAGTGSVALAAKREPLVIVTPVPVIETLAVPVAVVAPAETAIPTSVSPVARPEPAPRPEAPIAAPEDLAVITNPSWSQHPAPSYPAAAIEQGSFSGQVDLSCTVVADGRVSNCSVLREDPASAGYGAAALAAAASARLSPRTVDGNPTGGTVRFTIRFNRAAE